MAAAPASCIVFGRALFDFEGAERVELSFKAGDKIEISKQIDDDWFEGKLNGVVGLVPINFIDLIEFEDEASVPSVPFVRVEFDFEATGEFELSIHEGEVIELVRHVDAEWLEGRKDGVQGLFPSAYVTIVRDLPEPAAVSPLPVSRLVASPEPPTSPPSLQRPAVKSKPVIAEKPVVAEKPAVATKPVFVEKPAISAKPALTPKPASVSPSTTNLKPVVAPKRLSMSELPAASAKPVVASRASPVPAPAIFNPAAIVAAIQNVPRRGSFGVDSSPVPNPSNTLSTVAETAPKTQHAEVLFDFAGEVETELSASVGDILEIIRDIDDEWTEARLKDRTGLIPRNYLQLVEMPAPLPAPKPAPKPVAASRQSGIGLTKAQSADNVGVRVRNTLSFSIESSPTPDIASAAPRMKTFGGNSLNRAPVTKSLSTDSPYDRGNVSDTLSPSPLQQSLDSMDNSVSNFPSDLKDCVATALNEFIPEYDDELFLYVGDRVQVLRVIDEFWLEGKIRGKVGRFPTAYTKLTYGNVDEPVLPADDQEHVTLALAMHDFTGVNAGELTVAAGETLYITQQLSDGWYEAKTSADVRGIIPISYVEILQEFNPIQTLSPPRIRHSGHAEQQLNKATSAPRPTPRKRETGSFSEAPPPASTNVPTTARQPALSTSPPKPTHPRPARPPVSARTASTLPTQAQTPTAASQQPARPVAPRPSPVARATSFSVASSPSASASTVTPSPKPNKLSFSLNKKKEVRARPVISIVSAAPMAGSTPPPVLSPNGGSSSDIVVTQETPGNPEAKAAGQRANVVNEIVCTEGNYLEDLQLLKTGYYDRMVLDQYKGVDIRLLFGNLEEVISVSHRLYSKLYPALEEDMQDQQIGTHFLSVGEDLKTIYSNYCSHHDDANEYLVTVLKNPSVAQYFADCHAAIKDRTNVWDLSTFLIKPVQRVLKYPLLLAELLKVTPNDHPDKPTIQAAMETMKGVAQAINESKRRKELVNKYTNKDQQASISWRSVKKKGGRLMQTTRNKLGGDRTVDHDFEHEENLFRNLYKTVQVLHKHLEGHLEALRENQLAQLELAIAVAEFYGELQNDNVHMFKTAAQSVQRNSLTTYEVYLKKRVITPMDQLLALFKNPVNLIEKRNNKLLDHDKLKTSDRSDEETILAQNVYEALNMQLLEELPLFRQQSQLFLATVASSLVLGLRILQQDILREMKPLESLFTHSRGMSCMETFRTRTAAAVAELTKMTIIPEYFNKVFETATTGRGGTRSKTDDFDGNLIKELRREVDDALYLRASYVESRTQLEQTGDDEGCTELDSQISEIDNNVAALEAQIAELELSQRSSRASTAAKRPPGPGSRATFHNEETAIVEFDYVAEADSELTVNAGDRCKVIRRCDETGNPEWWLVSRHGQRGYVPSDFFLT